MATRCWATWCLRACRRPWASEQSQWLETTRVGRWCNVVACACTTWSVHASVDVDWIITIGSCMNPMLSTVTTMPSACTVQHGAGGHGGRRRTEAAAATAAEEGSSCASGRVALLPRGLASRVSHSSLPACAGACRNYLQGRSARLAAVWSTHARKRIFKAVYLDSRGLHNQAYVAAAARLCCFQAARTASRQPGLRMRCVRLAQ